MIVCADAAALPFRDQSVDLVLCSPPSAMDHHTRREALSEIGRVAKGRVVVLANTPGQQMVPGYRYPAFGEMFTKVQIGLNSQPGDVVLDCFAGTGVTARVAQKMGRHGVASELHEPLCRRM